MAILTTSATANGDRPGGAGTAALLRGRRENRISLVLALILAVLWMSFILLVAFAKELLATLVADGVTLGLALALGLVVSAWLLALLYLCYGNRRDGVVRVTPAGKLPTGDRT